MDQRWIEKLKCQTEWHKKHLQKAVPTLWVRRRKEENVKIFFHRGREHALVGRSGQTFSLRSWYAQDRNFSVANEIRHCIENGGKTTPRVPAELSINSAMTFFVSSACPARLVHPKRVLHTATIDECARVLN